MVKWYESRERRVSSIPPLRSWLVILIPADVCIRPSVWVCASVVKQNPCSVSGRWAWSPRRSFFFSFHLVCVTWLRGVFVNWKPPAEGADQDLQEGGVEASDGRAVDGR